jgi:ribosomal protein L12E/L44/L45/RPP1/RPP2
MPKKQAANKSQAVRDYRKTHPQATNIEIAAVLTKQGIKVTPNYVATVKSKLKQRRLAKKSAAAKAVAPASPTAVAAEKPTRPGDAVTIEQIKAVGQMVKAAGGFGRFREMLDVIRQVGGLKRLRDLLDAMSVTDKDVVPF